MKISRVIGVLVLILLLNSCGDGGDSSSGGSLPSPAITNFTPASGVTGTSVTVNGTNFPTNISDINITFCGMQITPDSATSTQIVFTVPSMGASSCLINLATSNGTISSGNSFDVKAIPTTTLASGLGQPSGLAVDATDVYLSAGIGVDAIIEKVGINGGTVTTLATSASGLYFPVSVSVDTANVYWIDGGGLNNIKKVGINGGTVTTLASSVTPYYHYTNTAVDSVSVYWALSSVSSGIIQKVGINGEPVTTLASGLDYDIGGIAIDSNYIYWTEGSGGSVKRIGLNGGPVTTLATGLSYPGRIAVDSTSVYWTEDVVPNGTVKKVAINGGTVTTLASGLIAPSALAVDSTNVYWTESGQMGGNGAVKKVGKNGGAVSFLAAGLSSPAFITVDSNSIYWLDSGNLEKVAK
jgi:IPT/TIG domain